MAQNENDTITRNHAVRQLFDSCFGALISAVSDTPDLMAQQAKATVIGLGRYLDRYDGPLEPFSFLCWANAFLQPASMALALYAKHRKEIEAGFWAAFYSKRSGRNDSDLLEWEKTQSDPVAPTSDDYDAGLADEDRAGYKPIRPVGTFDELQSEFFCWLIGLLMTKPETLLNDGAPLGARLHAKARFLALTWRKAAIRRRQRYTHAMPDWVTGDDSDNPDEE